jgi:hypothetical protein
MTAATATSIVRTTAPGFHAVVFTPTVASAE